MCHAAELVTQCMLVFWITGIDQDLARNHVDGISSDTRLHGFTRFFDGSPNSDEATLHFRRRLRLAIAQYIDEALNVGTVILVFHAEIKVNDVPWLDPDVRRAIMPHGRIRSAVDGRAILGGPR